MRYWRLRWILLSLSGCAAATLCAQSPLSDYRFAALGGPAVHTGAAGHPFQLALNSDVNLFHPGREDLAVGVQVEGGFFHPAISGTGNFYFSTDALLAQVQPERAESELKLRPFAAAGYTRLFTGTSSSLTMTNAVNFGVGVDRVLNEELWLRLEVREHYMPASDSHALVFRIGLVGVGSLR